MCAVHDIHRLLVEERDPGVLAQGVCDLLVKPGYVESAWVSCGRSEDGGPIIAHAGKDSCFGRAHPQATIPVTPVCAALLDHRKRATAVVVHHGCCEGCGRHREPGYAAVVASLCYGGVRYGVLGVTFADALEPGDPTTTVVELIAADLAHALHVGARERAETRGKSTQQSTIVLVEDDEDLRQVLRAMLRPVGLPVLEASSCEEALALLVNEPPLALLVTDVQLPGRSGIHLAWELRADRPGLPVLFISGGSIPDVLRLKAPGDDWRFLAKPFTAQVFLHAVGSLLSFGARAVG